MKTFFALILALLVLLSVLAWRTEPRAVENGKTVLTWVSDDNPMRRAQIDPFNREHPEYDLRLDPVNGGLEKVIVQAIAGVGPDLFDCYNPSELTAYVRSGVAWDITDELHRMGIDVRTETWPAVHPDCIRNGRVYGFPTNAAVNGLWYHKDFLDEAGIPYPRGQMSWDELVKLAEKLTVRDATGRIVRYGFICDWTRDYSMFIAQAGGHFYSADGTRCVVDSPQAVAGVQFMYDLIYKYHVSPGLADELAMATQGGWGVGPIKLFGAKRVAMGLGGRYWLCTLRSYPDMHLGASEAPHGPLRLFVGYGKATCINAASPRRMMALDFLKYLHSQQYNELINEQADGVGPVMKYTETPQFLHDPKHPEETYNAVWREMQLHAIPEEVSPFINGAAMKRITESQFDLIRSNVKTPAEGLHAIAVQVNAEIQRTIAKNPELRKLYEQRLAESAHHAATTQE